MKRTSTIILSLLMVMMVLVGCGKDSAKEETTATEERIVTTACRSSYINEEWYNKMNAAFEAETGIKVIAEPTPGNDDDHDAKVNINLIAGGDIDVIQSQGGKFYFERVEAGFFAPLSDLIAAKGIDLEAKYGANLAKDENGEFYAIPVKQEIFCVFYNKDLFDRAGVPYPEGPWTWDEFADIAAKVADPENGIYGAFLKATGPLPLVLAQQENYPLYKADGSCNFDAPRWQETLEWYKTLGDEGIIMNMEDIRNENTSWNYWALAGDHVAMFPNGNWFTRLLNSQADYPRDWKYGVTQIPTTGNENGNNNLVSMAYASVNVNAAHPEEALEYALWLGENQWKYEGGIPALATLSEEQQKEIFSGIADASEGQVTVDQLYNSWVNTGMGVAYSDLIGPASGEYHSIINEELSSYCLDLQDIDTTIDNITSRVNEALKNIQ